jgi:predicted nucleic acid-binding protein
MEFPKGKPVSRQECFVDSVCWIALLNMDDQYHIMQERDLKEVLTNDKHFVQAGFNATFRTPMTK